MKYIVEILKRILGFFSSWFRPQVILTDIPAEVAPPAEVRPWTFRQLWGCVKEAFTPRPLEPMEPRPLVSREAIREARARGRALHANTAGVPNATAPPPMTLYHEAHEHIHRAKAYAATGEILYARAHYSQAGELQWQYVSTLPDDRITTIAVYGLSAATLFFRGHDFARAAEIASALLGRPDIKQNTVSKLENLLTDIRAEKSAEQSQ
jgi:hypothetical protein